MIKYHIVSIFWGARETWIAHDTLLGKLRQHVFCWFSLRTSRKASFCFLLEIRPGTLVKCSSTSSWIFCGQSVATASCCPRQFFSPNLRRFPWCHHRAKPKQLREYRHSSTWGHLSHGFFDICGVPAGGTFLSWKLRNYQLISNHTVLGAFWIYLLFMFDVFDSFDSLSMTNLNLGGIWGHQAIQWLGGFLQRGCHWHACYILPGLWIQLCWWVAQTTWRQEVVQWLENETLQQIDRTNLHFTQFPAEELLYLNRSKMIKDMRRKTCCI